MKVAIVPVTPFVQNCTVLWCEETMRGAICDPGGDLEKILGFVDEQGVSVEKIIVTHAHVDHAGGVADLAEKLDVPIEGPHRDDQFWIDLIEPSGQQYGLKDARAFSPDRWLEQGDVIKVGNVELETFHCPGHTPGHVIFYSKSENLAIVGDVLFKGSIGRTDFPRGNNEDLISSIRTNLWPLGNDVTFVCGHGPVSTFGEERKSNPFVADHIFS